MPLFLYYAFLIVQCALCNVHCALCIVHYALCIMNCALKKNVTARQISLPDGQLYEL